MSHIMQLLASTQMFSKRKSGKDIIDNYTYTIDYDHNYNIITGNYHNDRTDEMYHIDIVKFDYPHITYILDRSIECTVDVTFVLQSTISPSLDRCCLYSKTSHRLIVQWIIWTIFDTLLPNIAIPSKTKITSEWLKRENRKLKSKEHQLHISTNEEYNKMFNQLLRDKIETISGVKNFKYTHIHRLYKITIYTLIYHKYHNQHELWKKACEEYLPSCVKIQSMNREYVKLYKMTPVNAYQCLLIKLMTSYITSTNLPVECTKLTVSDVDEAIRQYDLFMEGEVEISDIYYILSQPTISDTDDM